MKYPNHSQSTNMAVNNGSHIDEVDSIFTSPCWQNSNSSLQNDYLDTTKLMLGSPISNLGSDKLLLGSPLGQDDNEMETKDGMDVLDNLLNSQTINTSLAELKPLPPFTNYTANLSINGIQGHHYHGIGRISEENNNSYNNFNEQNIVSSSTCNVSADSAGNGKNFSFSETFECVDPDSVSSLKYKECAQVDSATNIKTEITEYDISSIEDIAAIIGSAIAADTTVPNNNTEVVEHPTDSRDSWMDIETWFEGTCSEQQKALILTQEGVSEFVIPCATEYKSSNNQVNDFVSSKTQPQQNSSTLQTLLTYGMPLLQNRLQHGPPIKQEAPSSTNFHTELITTSSPPANVVSTTDNLLVTVNGRFLPPYSIHGMNEDHRIRSPDMLSQNFPHTTTTTPNVPKRKRPPKNKQPQPTSSTVFQTDQTLGLLGKEKPVHRCSICNRGFLNKSNIKVHLRTHTGEKPFRCDTCAKAFRQKAHLLKHQQIHKRIGRD